MSELNIILVIAICLFVLYLINCSCNPNAQQYPKKQYFENNTTQQQNSPPKNAQEVHAYQQKALSEDNYQGILMAPLLGDINSTGIISSNNVNTGLLLGDDTDEEVIKYKLNYQNIVENEIGQDNIKSQKEYSKYIKNDSAMRYLDTDLSANYSNYYGLSLSRGAKASQIAATDSSQIQGLDANAYDTNINSLREFYLPPASQQQTENSFVKV